MINGLPATPTSCSILLGIPEKCFAQGLTVATVASSSSASSILSGVSLLSFYNRVINKSSNGARLGKNAAVTNNVTPFSNTGFNATVRFKYLNGGFATINEGKELLTGQLKIK